MKVYMSVDMEGIAGVVSGQDTDPEGNVEYQRAREWMTAEVNAAIEGAKEAGAKGIVISDSHGFMRNLLIDKLPADVLIVRGSPRAGCMMEGLDESFDAAFLIGYHSAAGNATGVLAHTYLGSGLYRAKINDMIVGEPGFNIGIAGHYGVPVALVAGDDTVKEEIDKIIPETESVITKWAISTTAAKTLTPKGAQEKIRASAKRALERLPEMKAWKFGTPITMEIEFMKPVFAHVASDIPGVERLDGRTIKFTGKDMLEALKLFRAACNTMIGPIYI